MRFATLRRLVLVPALALSLGAAACGGSPDAGKAAAAEAGKPAPAGLTGKLAALMGPEAGPRAARGGDDGARAGLVDRLKGALSRAKDVRLEDLGVTEADLAQLGISRGDLDTLRAQAAQLWREGMDAAQRGEVFDPGFGDDGGYDPGAY